MSLTMSGEYDLGRPYISRNTVIGRFLYSARPLKGLVAVEMIWQGSRREGILLIPEPVTLMMVGTDFERIEHGNRLILPLALSVAVAIAMFTFSDLCLCGDRTVWAEDWGRLESLEPGKEMIPH